MNYRHIFHAGNFADVFRHIILIQLIQSLTKKETPFCYLETHAGAGIYDLTSNKAQTNQESKDGIVKLFPETDTPPLISDYLSCVRKLNEPNPEQLRFYPGSPYFAKQFLRPQDRMVLCELQPDVNLELKKLFRHDKQVAIHQQNGYQGLKAFLPPKERRGLILIDPPYETPDELILLTHPLKEAVERFSTGTYAVWYPIKLKSPVDVFHRTIQSTIPNTILIAELSLYPINLPNYLNGCGMLIVNPPWELDAQLQPLLAWLLDKLNVREGKLEIKYLTKRG